LRSSAPRLSLCQAAATRKYLGKLLRSACFGTREAPKRNYLASLTEGFRDLGYVEGRTILFEHRYAHEQYDRFPALAQELVDQKVDALMASILPAARAAEQATKTTPIVFVIVADPVGSGPAESLAHPGRNLTGMSNVTEDLTAKRVQIFKDTVPDLKRMGLIVHPGGQSPQRVFDEYRAAAKALGIETIVLEARTPSDLDAAMESASTQRVDAVATAPDSMIFNSRYHLAELALKYRLPYMGANLDAATAGARPGSLTGTVKVAIADWAVCLKAAHPGYIGWEEFMANQRRMSDNASRYQAGHPGVPRQGSALLQGIAICGRCGRRMSLRYSGPKADYPVYCCRSDRCRSTRWSSVSSSKPWRRIRSRSRLRWWGNLRKRADSWSGNGPCVASGLATRQSEHDASMTR
jgi:ABC transporter substrate binding protein